MKLLSFAASTGTLPLEGPGRTSGEGNRRVKQTGCAPVRIFLGFQPFEARRGPNKLAVSSPGQTQTIEGESKTISKVPVEAKSVSGVAAAAAQSFLLRLPPRLSSSSFSCRLGFCTPSRLCISSSISHRPRRHFNPLVTTTTTTTTASAVSADSKTPSTIITNNVNLATEGIEIEPEIEGGGSGIDGYGDLGGSGGGGGGGGGVGGNKGGGGEEDNSGILKKIERELFVLRLLTLLYAMLLGFEGATRGNLTSLGLAGVAMFVLERVFSKLPTNPATASYIGLMVASSAIVLTFQRLYKSKEVFPTGVSFLASVIMDRGYLHGIVRGWEHRMYVK